MTTSSIDPNLLDQVEPVEGSAAASRHVRIVDAIEPAILLVSIVFALTALTFAVVSWTGGFWLPLDAAHFSAEAEWLRGNRDVLPNIHPPLFPGLVLLADLVVGWRDAVLMAMSLAFALYVVAVYALLRRWHRRSFAWFGAVLAATSPVLAEILGWGGGANLLGFAALIGACAPAERWTETGGGGLVSGCALAIRHRHPATRVYTAEPSEFDDARRSLEAGERVVNRPGAASICDALQAPTPGVLTFALMRRLLAGGFAVTDDEVRAAMAFAFRRLRLVVEPGGAVALAAVLCGRVLRPGDTLESDVRYSSTTPAFASDLVKAEVCAYVAHGLQQCQLLPVWEVPSAIGRSPWFHHAQTFMVG